MLLCATTTRVSLSWPPGAWKSSWKADSARTGFSVGSVSRSTSLFPVARSGIPRSFCAVSVARRDVLYTRA